MRRKKTSGKHKVARGPVMFPLPWLNLAKKLAAEARRPVQWYLCELLEKAAKEQGLTDIPAGPWEERAE
jgi:hypothetical protein